MFSEARGYSPEQEFFGKNYYEILGVSVDSSQSEIKSAYRDLAKKYHTDVGGDEIKIKYITEAYNELKDEKKRGEYDIKKNIKRSPKQDSSKKEAPKQEQPKENQKADQDKKEQAPPKEPTSGPTPQSESESEPEETPDWNRVRRTEDYADQEANFQSKLKINSKPFHSHEVFFLVNEEGKKVSREYKALEKFGTYFLGKNSIGLSRLVDPATGGLLGRTYTEIFFRDGVIIGKNEEGVEHLIHKTSGREMGDVVNGYKQIKREGNKVIGVKDGGGEEVIAYSLF